MPKKSVKRSSKKNNTWVYILIVIILVIAIIIYFVYFNSRELRFSPTGVKPTKPILNNPSTEPIGTIPCNTPNTCCSPTCGSDPDQSSCKIECFPGTEPYCRCVFDVTPACTCADGQTKTMEITCDGHAPLSKTKAECDAEFPGLNTEPHCLCLVDNTPWCYCPFPM